MTLEYNLKTDAVRVNNYNNQTAGLGVKAGAVMAGNSNETLVLNSAARLGITGLTKTLIPTILLTVCMMLTPGVFGQTPVTVSNTQAQAVPVKDQYNGALHPVSFMFSLSIPSGYQVNQQTYKVPAGKRLVIETVSTYATGADAMLRFTVMTTVGGANSAITLPIAPPVSWGQYEPVQVGTTTFRSYADPNTSVQVWVQRATITGLTSASATLIGYLVDVP